MKSVKNLAVLLFALCLMAWPGQEALGGTLAAWGIDDGSAFDFGQCDVPPGNNFAAVATGYFHSLALKSDGSLSAWGIDDGSAFDFGQLTDVPTGNNFAAVAAGHDHSLALKSDGSLVAWGSNEFGQCNVPAGNNFAAIACTWYHSLAIKSDGSLAAWGWNNYGQCDVPAGNNFAAVATGWFHSLAIKSDGSLAAWGIDDGSATDFGQVTDVPPGNDFVAIAASAYHSLALKSDGSLVAWGVSDDSANDNGQVTDTPAGNDFAAIAAGHAHNLALKSDGSLAAWGRNDSRGQCDVPEGNDFVAIAAGCGEHSLARRFDEPMGTAFTYQGLINPNDFADGRYDFEFKLYNSAAGGNQIRSTIHLQGVEVIDGHFKVELDFGPDIFTGYACWLETTVEQSTQSPRTELTPTPYSIYAEKAQEATDLMLPYSGTVSSGAATFSMTNTGTGYAGHFEQTGSANTKGGLNVTTDAGRYGARILNQGGNNYSSYGLLATTEKDTGSYMACGIQSIANNNYSTAFGLRSEATSTYSNAYGGHFRADAGGSTAWGIVIDADNTSWDPGESYGIRLYSDCANGRAYGIYSSVGAGSGSTSNLYGIYSYGKHLGINGTSYGMYSSVIGSDSGDSYGIYSEGRKYSSDTAGTAYGGYFIGDNDRTDGDSYGLYTTATGANGRRYGLYSEVTTSSGSYDNYGLYTEVANNNGYSYGFLADLGPGKEGMGVWVNIETTEANTSNQYGLYAFVDHGGTGNLSGDVYGVNSKTYSSETGYNHAGCFEAFSNPGDWGNLYGIYARCNNYTFGAKYAGYFYKEGGGDYAGYFYGNVRILGDLTKSGGSFKIDHPLDPENKYLSHSFVESPDMMNVYNGNAILDKNGEAVVKLPEYFEALNRDFRYQLTAIGAPGPNLYIAEKISDNCFKIAGGKSGMEVSWQVTGVRHDPYAVANRVQVEEEKKDEERGYYLNPMAYGLPEEKAIESVRNPRVLETRQVAKNEIR